MGLLNHLFGSKKCIAKELAMDDKKRIALWQQHLANYTKRELLSKHLSYIDKALQDFNATENVLKQIESLILPELINISGEEKLDEEILADLSRLKSTAEIEGLLGDLAEEKRKQAILLTIFHEIHDILKVELHLIKLIRKKPPNIKDLLLRLFKLIFHNEAMLYNAFRKETFYDKSVHVSISRIARAIILQEELKEEIETDEEKFARKMVIQMVPGESKRRYRQLGEDIYFELAELAGAPMADILKGIKKLEKFMKDDMLLHSIIKKLRPKYDDSKIRVVMMAFRKAYDLGHFEDLAVEFVT